MVDPFFASSSRYSVRAKEGKHNNLPRRFSCLHFTTGETRAGVGEHLGRLKEVAMRIKQDLS